MNLGRHQLIMLEIQLDYIDYLSQLIDELDEEIGIRLETYKEELELLDSIPRVNKRITQQTIESQFVVKKPSCHRCWTYHLTKGLYYTNQKTIIH